MKLPILIICFLLLMLNGVYAQKKKKQELRFSTADGHVVRLDTNHIYYDNKVIFKHKYPGDVIIGLDKDHLVEDAGSVFLLVYTFGAPNLDTYKVYQITPTRARFITESIASPIKDYDNGGKLEFGGRDLTEIHPSCDSMYYIPSQYFEIAKGKILFDKALTRKMDIKLNGMYLSHSADKDGNCCKVIPITKRERKAERKQKGGVNNCQ